MNARKILIPVVAGLLFSPALMAADLDSGTDTTTFSIEFLGTAGATDVVTGGAVVLELRAEYAVGDIVTLAFSGSALDGTTMPSSIVTTATAINGITLGLLSADADSAIYRVTDITAGSGTITTVGTLVVFAETAAFLDFDAQAVAAAGSVTITFSAETGTGLALDTGGGDLRSALHVDTAAEYSAATVAGVDLRFDEIIDVNAQRLGFAGDTVDIAAVTLAKGTPSFPTSFDSQDVVWSGDFSWIQDDDDMTAGVQPASGVVIVNNCTGLSDLTVTTSDISYSCTLATATTLTLDPVSNFVDPDTANTTAISEGSFSVSVTANYTGFDSTTGSVSFAGMAGGAWVLNGYQALIPYMPYGVGISQVIYLANRGSQAGEVTVEWIDQNGSSGSLGVIGTLGAGTTMKIGQLIQNALPAAQRASGRLALTVTANVPAGDVQMNSQYNVNGNRAFTLHEDNRN